MFCCSHVEKCATPDEYDKGCDPNGRRCVMDENVSIRSETMGGLIRKLENRYGLTIDSIWVGALEDGRISFNRQENGHGHPPAPHEIESWKLGKGQMWLADWDFCIEKIIVQPVTAEDMAYLVTHE